MSRHPGPLRIRYFKAMIGSAKLTTMAIAGGIVMGKVPPLLFWDLGAAIHHRSVP